MTDSFETDAQWLPKTSAGELVGVSHTTVRRWGLAGSVAERVGDDGTTLYSVADCKRMATSGGADLSTPNGGMAALVRVAVDLLRQAERHNQQLLEPNRKALALLGKENGRIAKQNDSLHRKLERMQEAHEKSRSLEHERLMAQSKFESAQKMKGEMFAAGMEYVPMLGQVLMSRVGAKDGGAAGAAMAESAVLRVLAAMTDEQLGAMHESGAFTDAQLMMLLELRRRVRDAAPPAGGASPPVEPEPQPQPEPEPDREQAPEPDAEPDAEPEPSVPDIESTTEGESDDGEEIESEETEES